MVGTLERGVLIGAALVVALLIVNADLGHRNTQQLNEDAGWVAHTHEVLDLTAGVLLTVVDAETGERGFVITGKDEFLKPYHAAVARFDERMSLLKEKTRDNDRQQERIEKLEKMTVLRLTLLGEGIALRRQGEKEAQAFLIAKRGHAEMESIRRLIAEIERDEQQLLKDREQRSLRAYHVALTVGLLTPLIGLVLVAAFVWLLRRSLRARQNAAASLREQEEWFRTTLASIGDAVIATDRQRRVRFMNAVAETLTGWSLVDARGMALTDVFKIVNEHTRQPVEDPALRALNEGGVVGLANHTVLIGKHGAEWLIDDSAASILDDRGSILGAVLVFRDVTERRQAEEEVRFQARLLDTVGQAAIVTDPNGAIIYWNRFAETLYGWPKNEVLGRNIVEIAMAPESMRQAADVMHRLRAGESWSGEFLVRHRDGTPFFAFITDTPIFDEQGKLTAIIGISADVTDRKKMEQALRFLADASATLGTIVDYQSTLQKVAGLAVPQFADWCAVDMLEPDGAPARVATVHADPAKVKLAQEFHRLYPTDAAAAHGLPQVLRTGEAQMMTDIPDALLVAAARDEEHLRMLRELGLRSYMSVPLKGRGKLLGVVSFGSAESGRRYTKADLAFAEELARRASIAIENAQLYAELRNADRHKDEFLATLAHELRNPLAPIRNSLQILKMPLLDAATAQRSREMMERQVHQLVRLVDDLLDVSRVMRGKIELRKERVELASVIARAVETVQPLIEAQGHELTIAVSSQPLPLDADPVRLAQVVGNLLANAAKYTEAKGHIWLTAEPDGDRALLRVRDNGIGIAPDMLAHIFDLFVQVDHASTRSQGGLGIGLTLVRNLVEMHTGTVAAHSAGLAQGSEFVVRLPLAFHELDAPAGRENAEPPPPVPASGRRLLVVDDNRDAADSLALLLRLQGHQVQVAHGGAAALAIAIDYRPEMIFLDIGMPGMDGYEVARRLRQQAGLENVVLTAVTGWGQQEDRRRSAEAGFDHHLVKPPEPKALESLLVHLKSRDEQKARRV